MPIYVYQCAQCDTHLEKRQGFSEAPLSTCEDCGGSLRRVLQPVGVIFKGSGFYSTDYRGGAAGKRDGANGEAKTGGSSEAGGAPDKGSESSAPKATGEGKTSTAATQTAASGTKSE
jgi:putative FmdB family regulatory protein